MIETRHHLHEHPEVSFEEKETSKYIKDFYQKLDMEVKSCCDGYGLIVDIDSGKPGKHLAIRADFDALPVNEENDLSFKSQNKGVMHACGHDAHTAYLMYVAKAMNMFKGDLTGQIRIIHQLAEEQTPGGALSMIKDGCLDGIDNILGVHVGSYLAPNKMYYHYGASMPQLSNDAILAGSYFVNEVQSIVSRRVNPKSRGVVTVGSFDGKGSANAISGSVQLDGDVRYFDNTTRDVIEKNIEDICAGLERAFSVKVDLNYNNNYPVLNNDHDFTDYTVKTIKAAGIDVEECGQQDPSEDFAYYTEKVPGTYLFAGASVEDGQSHPHHSSNFLIDEKCLLTSAKSVSSVVADYLK